MDAGQAAAAFIALGAGQGRFRVVFVGDTLVMGGAAGADDQVLCLLLCFDQLLEHRLITKGSDVRHGFTASGAYQEEDIQHVRTAGAGKIDHRLHFVGVALGHREVHLEGEVVFFAQIHRREGFLPTAGASTEIVVAERVKGVEADAHAHCASLLEFYDTLLIEQHAIGPHHHGESNSVSMRHQLFKIAAQQGFAAGEHHHCFIAA